MAKYSVVDSSVWIGLFLEFDSQHKKASDLIKSLRGKIYIPYCVLNETATVLVYKHSKEQADNFLNYVRNNSDIEVVDSKHNEEATYFLKTKKRVSFTDVALLYYSFALDAGLATFDKQLENIWKKIRVS